MWPPSASCIVSAVRPLFHPQLVNDRFGDPGLYLEFMFERRALLFDLGELGPLSARKLLRVSHAFVSHAHMDHFSGFDRLLRVCLGRDRRLHLFGPAGFIERVAHKLAAYSWNLVANYANDFTLVVSEFGPDERLETAWFHCQTAFRPEPAGTAPIIDGVLIDEDGFRVRAAVLDHDIPCLAFAIEEKSHVNVWKNRVEAMGFRVGPWLRELKQAVLRGDPEDTPFRVWWREDGTLRETRLPLGELTAEILRVVPGQKIGYVVDAAYHDRNAARIVDLARGADILFIEARFLQEDAEAAARKFHLTAQQAGTLARAAEAKRLVPFHFSTRYTGREDHIIGEAEAAFAA
jgi:ribonuclease Z